MMTQSVISQAEAPGRGRGQLEQLRRRGGAFMVGVLCQSGVLWLSRPGSRCCARCRVCFVAAALGAAAVRGAATLESLRALYRCLGRGAPVR